MTCYFNCVIVYNQTKGGIYMGLINYSSTECKALSAIGMSGRPEFYSGRGVNGRCKCRKIISRIQIFS